MWFMKWHSDTMYRPIPPVAKVSYVAFGRWASHMTLCPLVAISILAWSIFIIIISCSEFRTHTWHKHNFVIQRKKGSNLTIKQLLLVIRLCTNKLVWPTFCHIYRVYAYVTERPFVTRLSESWRVKLNDVLSKTYTGSKFALTLLITSGHFPVHLSVHLEGSVMTHWSYIW